MRIHGSRRSASPGRAHSSPSAAEAPAASANLMSPAAREDRIRTAESAADPQMSPPPEWTSWSWFIQRVLALVGIVFLAYLLWQARETFLLAFAAVIIATLLLAASGPIERHTPLSHRWSLTVAGLAILAGIALALYLMGSQVRSQIDELTHLLPQALRYVEQQFGIVVPGVGSADQRASSFSLSSDLMNRLASWSYAAVDVIASLVLVIAGGVFFAVNPDIYRQGLVLLFPKSQHARADDALQASGQALRLWLLAELIAMGIIGVLAGLGTWLIGLPAPAALGLFAGVTEFIPVMGPILGALPALLLALTQGTSTFLWTVGLFVAIQQLESNVITPIIERRMVRIPPALFLFAVFALWLLFGALGVIIGAPLTVVLYVLVKKLYVRQTLGEDTKLPVD